MNDVFLKMITPCRFRETSVTKHPTDGRNPFESDLSRVTLSSHFRRLQDKAQVFPLEQCDFVRTRLTHSIEVACFARGLGLGVEKHLLEKEIINSDVKGYIPTILEVAGLIHDVGNPPFGHFGEEVIRTYFSRLQSYANRECDFDDPNINPNIVKAFKGLTPQQKEDFLNFDGNVQGFRILRRLGLAKDQYSYNLTMPVLSTIIKYPYSSIEGNKKEGKYSQKKFGYFLSEKHDYEEIVEKLGLKNNQRHPLTYLLEAADDIAYSASDIEDGNKLGIITLDHIKKTFKDNGCEEELQPFKQFEKDNNIDLYVQQLRISAQSKLLIETTKTFNQNFEGILDGSFDEDIIKASDAKQIRMSFEALSIYNFGDKTVLKRELLGERVMNFLLQTFYNALFSDNLFKDNEPNKKSKEYKLLSLISDNYMKIAREGNVFLPEDNYIKFMLITDFISGMTDSYALNLYQELTGVTM